ncbi:hypothetical protein GNIT_1334 [Glaciecola nitratireducens FR1064]|uniref:CBU-0592-like domain-containing protein n=2 Tax=Brumicola TaxID=3160924 RepID=G4QGD3_GLANF|nr:hypothetical protein [Glaciecola nitratireducens]AEP29458.1 hypothetical protein GNIT_1334 [Glaciecola nitratireducens FR1064]
MFMLILGWCGTFLYLANHAYISLVTSWRPKVYFSGNLFAATALTVQSVHLSSWQAAVINGFWMTVSTLLLIDVKIDSVKIRAKSYFSFSALMLLAASASFFLIEITTFYEVLGWSSAYFFCSSYFLFSAKIISSRAYLSCNVYAALALLPQLWLSANYPVLTLEVAWAIVSLIGIIKSYNEVHLID